MAQIRRELILALRLVGASTASIAWLLLVCVAAAIVTAAMMCFILRVLLNLPTIVWRAATAGTTPRP